MPKFTLKSSGEKLLKGGKLKDFFMRGFKGDL
jgi:hypothetical protein